MWSRAGNTISRSKCSKIQQILEILDRWQLNRPNYCGYLVSIGAVCFSHYCRTNEHPIWCFCVVENRPLWTCLCDECSRQQYYPIEWNLGCVHGAICNKQDFDYIFIKLWTWWCGSGFVKGTFKYHLGYFTTRSVAAAGRFEEKWVYFRKI